MKPKKVKHTPEFVRALKRLPQSQLKNLATKEQIFLKNPFDPRLRTHRLKGKLSGFYSFSVSFHWRIVFHFNDETVCFDTIGTHPIYR